MRWLMTNSPSASAVAATKCCLWQTCVSEKQTNYSPSSALPLGSAAGLGESVSCRIQACLRHSFHFSTKRPKARRILQHRQRLSCLQIPGSEKLFRGLFNLSKLSSFQLTPPFELSEKKQFVTADGTIGRL